MGTGSVSVLDSFVANGPSGKPMALELARELDWDHVLEVGLKAGMLGAAIAGGPGATVGAIGGAIADIARQARLGTQGGSIVRDAGSPPTTSTGVTYSLQPGDPASYKGSPDAALAYAHSVGALPAKVGQHCNSEIVGPTYQYDSQGRLIRFRLCPSDAPNTLYSYEIWTAIGQVDDPCPAYVDQLSGASVPAGSPPGADGKCRLGVYTSIAIAQARAAINGTTAWQSAAQSQAPAMVQDAVSKGVEVVPQRQELTGPASQVGDPVTTTTTNPDGTTKTETKTPTYNYSYSNGDTITYNTSNTTITNNNGQTTTTTTTSSGSGGDDVDICKSNPTASACAELGSPPDPGELEHQTHDPTITPEDIPGVGGCPAPIVVSIPRIPPITFTFQPLCDICETIKPLVLMLGAFSAMWAFVGGFKV